MLAARLARCAARARARAHVFRIGASIHAPKLQFAGTIRPDGSGHELCGSVQRHIKVHGYNASGRGGHRDA